MTEEVVTPDPRLLESMRSVGYTVEAAVADIIDNSIAAGAKNVQIRSSASGPFEFAIVDDGVGMTDAEAIDAMRLAARSPMDERAPGDLGRFGLGLKTASLSQCRVLTLLTKRDGVFVGLRWSLDHVIETGRWALLRVSEEEAESLVGWLEFDRLSTGTMVHWRDLDQFEITEGDSQESLDRVLAERVRPHVGLVFHRFIDGDGVGKVRIRLNGRPIESADPFLMRHLGRSQSPAEHIDVAGGQIHVRAVTLPHVNSLSPDDRERVLRPGSLRDSQGFYVYRSGRLVIWGTWFRVTPRTEMAKLTRVKVDVPNSLDHLWALDIKKSSADPPPEVRRRLRELAERMIGPSKRVHTFRGRTVGAPETVERMWNLVHDRSGFRYEINPSHPVVRALDERLQAQDRNLLTALLSTVEASFPILDAHNRLSQDERSLQDDVDLDSLLQQATDLWPTFKAAGTPAESFIDLLMSSEPYALSPPLRAQLTKAIAK